MLLAVFTLRNIDSDDFDTDDWEYADCEMKSEKSYFRNGKPAVCIRQLCKSLVYNDSNCEEIEDDLEVAAKKKLNMDIDFTTDEDVCGKY